MLTAFTSPSRPSTLWLSWELSSDTLDMSLFKEIQSLGEEAFLNSRPFKCAFFVVTPHPEVVPPYSYTGHEAFHSEDDTLIHGVLNDHFFRGPAVHTVVVLNTRSRSEADRLLAILLFFHNHLVVDFKFCRLVIRLVLLCFFFVTMFFRGSFPLRVEFVLRLFHHGTGCRRG